VTPQSPTVEHVEPDRTAVSQSASLSDRQKAFLLQQLVEAPDNHVTLGDANKRIGAAAKREMQLDVATANRLRKELKESGYLREEWSNRKVSFTLTDEGRIHLQTLPHNLFPPVGTKVPKPPRSEGDVPPELLKLQQSYLLLVLFQANARKLAASEFASKLQTENARKVGFNGVIASQVIAPLLELGFIDEKRRTSGGDGLYPAFRASYRLTDQGSQYLFTVDQYPSIKVTMSGVEFNKFIAAFRATLPDELSTTAQSRDKPISPPLQVAPPLQPQKNLGEAILTRFNELLRENYTNAGTVPIHELRAWVKQQFGAEAASRKNFDEVVNDLCKQKKVRFVTLSDLRRGTPEQMEASIPGVNETFFYLEPAHEQSFDF
jgi:hypothetical protein